MASLEQVRGDIIEAVLVTEAEGQETVPDSDETDGFSDDTFDDEDFWTAIDMMETSFKLLQRLVRRHKFSPYTNRLVENHCDDLAQFIGEFIVEGDEGTK